MKQAKEEPEQVHYTFKWKLFGLVGKIAIKYLASDQAGLIQTVV